MQSHPITSSTRQHFKINIISRLPTRISIIFSSTLKIYGASDIPTLIQEHPDKLEKFVYLEYLYFEINDYYSGCYVRAQIFMESMRSLKRVTAAAAYGGSYNSFLSRQTTPLGWGCDNNGTSYICMREWYNIDGF